MTLLWALLFIIQKKKQYAVLRVQYMKMDVARSYSVMYKGIPKRTLQHISPVELFSQFFPGKYCRFNLFL